MANRRMISSDIFKDEWYGPLGFFEQQLWVGLFTACADDQGRLLDNPILIRADVFPYKDIPPAEIDAALAGFTDAGKIIRYEQGGKRLLQIVKWWENQQPQWASASKWPAPEGWADRIRTRQNGQYIEIGWRTRQEFGLPVQVNHQAEHTSIEAQVVRQSPVPVPIPVPVNQESGAIAPAAKPAAPDMSPESAKAVNRRTDPRSKHPAIQCVRGIMHNHYPPFELYDDAIRILGDKPDGKRLAECRREWIARGYSPTGWAWLLEWYANGSIPAKNNGHGPPRAPTQANDAWANMDVNAIIESNRIKERHDRDTT